MIKIYPYPSQAAEERLAEIQSRSLTFSSSDYQTVSDILEDIRENGDEALLKYTHRFDSPTMAQKDIRVTKSEMKKARRSVAPEFSRALERAATQIETFHRRQVRQSWIETDRDGILLGQLIRPVDAVGVYTPGGRSGQTPLVSSMLMCVIPAKIAGVKKIVVVTPPTRDGSINPHLLAAASAVGVDEIYKAGSAWAIGALAYGTETIPKVDVVVGPGNIYVTLAKKIVSGTVGIDLIAGPSEILVIADQTANAAFTAADLLSQAEHDPLASSVLVTDSPQLASEVAQSVEQQIEALSRKEIAKASLANYGAIFTVEDMETATSLANRLAPEHLELHVETPLNLMSKIRHAGAIFMGHYTPEPVGDYIAGPNHVLPTVGTARFASALSVDNFIKKTSIIQYDQKAFLAEADDIICLAQIEGLGAHAQSVKIRLDDGKK